jgi:drug/metabolite transporter (DMT)-like permease
MKMNWFILALLAVFSLGFMSFLITMLTRRGYPVPFVLFGIGSVVTICYFLQTLVFYPHAFTVTPGILPIFLGIGILAFLGNVLLYQAANNAPNAGLAIAIGGLQAIIVALLAFVFLKDKLTVLQIVGILFAALAVFLMGVGSDATLTHRFH